MSSSENSHPALKNVKVTLDKFDGQKDQFATWQWLFAAYLERHGLEGVISEEQIDIDLIDATENKTVYLLIATHVTAKVARVLTSVKNGDGRAAWKKLEKEFGDGRAMSRYSHLHELLFAILKSVDSEKLEEFLNRKKELGDKLKERPLTVDELMIIGAMRGLPPTLANAADVALFRENLTFEDFASLLKSKMEQIQLRKRDNDTGTALFVKNHNKGYGKGGHHNQYNSNKGKGKTGGAKGFKGNGKNNFAKNNKGKGKNNSGNTNNGGAKAFVSFSEAFNAAVEEDEN
jgi:hypothetical protein